MLNIGEYDDHIAICEILLCVCVCVCVCVYTTPKTGMVLQVEAADFFFFFFTHLFWLFFTSFAFGLGQCHYW